MNIALPVTLVDVEVADLEPGDRREAFRQHFGWAETLRGQAQEHADACSAIGEDLDRGDLVGFCHICQTPLFDKDKPTVIDPRRVVCNVGEFCAKATANG